jgi:primosomal protein N' (replication factor Y)
MPSVSEYVSVAVSGPFCRAFTYRFPPELDGPTPGQRLVVPFGRRSAVGFYLGKAEPPRGVEIKNVQRLIDPVSHVPADLFKLCLWISEYYVANPADCLSLAIPAVLRGRTSARIVWSAQCPAEIADEIRAIIKPSRAVTKEEFRHLLKRHRLSPGKLLAGGIVEEIFPDSDRKSRPIVAGYRVADASTWGAFAARRRHKPEPFEGERSRDELISLGWTGYLISAAEKAGAIVAVTRRAVDSLLDVIPVRSDVQSLRLTESQQNVCDQLTASLGAGFSTFLLHGITGSGKTLIYCRLAQATIARGGTVLILTPEIALAGTMLGYVRGFFGDRVTILHSAMSDRARLENRQAIKAGKCPIVIGPRSALFAPLPNLGLIIVDEEHDGSYKQDDPAPRFHGRDAAIMRARINDIPVLLGSASPSVESYHQAKTGKYRLLELTERPAGARLPSVRVVDLRVDRLGGDLPFFSYALKKEVERRIQLHEQVILFLNRRGYSSLIKCALCGHVPVCPKCDVRMTYHKSGGGRLACHYCGMVRHGYDVCESCKGRKLLYLGAGTQKLEESISRLFASARPLRFDSDAAAGDLTAHRLLAAFAAGDYDLLLGTQMVTKGLDLPNVSLVGVLSADHGLDLPDFRASEKTFARLLQVAGRSGRTERGGEVVIQTYYPENDVIRDAARQDYGTFFAREIAQRKEHNFPPFVRLANIELSGKNEEQVSHEAQAVANRLVERAESERVAVELLGPAPCPHYYLRGVYRRHLLIKSNMMVRLSRMLAMWEADESKWGVPAAIKVRLDIDPVDMM